MVDVAVPRRRVVVEALVLVFSRSEVSELVGTDALRTVVTGQYRELVVGDTLQLQPIWDLLADQPGFESDKAAPGFFLLETWQSDLGLEVVLPDELASVDADERRSAAKRCTVPHSDKEAVFRPEAATPAPAPRPRDTGVTPRKTARLEVDEVTDRRRGGGGRTGLEIAAALVAAVAFTFTGMTIYRACSGPAIEQVQIALPAELPVSRTERIGAELHATLADDGWLAEPEPQRRATLEAALEDLRSENIDILVVMAANGATMASAQWVGDPPRPAIKLY